MDAVVIENPTQIISFPLQTFDNHPDLSIGSYVQIGLNQIEDFALGQCVLMNPIHSNFMKLSQLCVPTTSEAHFKVSKIEKVIATEAEQIEVLVICKNIKSTLKLKHCSKNAVVQNLLRGLIFKPGFKFDFKGHPMAQEYGIKEIIMKSNHSNGVFKCTKNTILKSVQPVSCQRYYKTTKPIRLGGLTPQIEKLTEILKRTNSKGINLKGSLISGPPGCGKTNLVIKIADLNDFLCLVVQCSDLVRPHPGETEKVLQDVFKKAKEHAEEGNTMLLLENVDLIGNEKKPRILSQLRNLLDQNNSVVIAATTVIPTEIHESLRRPGRLTNEIFIQVPNLQERQEIIESLNSNHDSLNAEQILEISQCTQGYLGSDLSALLTHLLIGNKTEDVNFETSLKQALHVTTPSGFKSGIGAVRLNPILWTQIGGLQKIKHDLQSAIMWPLLYPEKFKKLDIKRTKGVLMYGPPGCGKTTLARAMASMSGATFFSISSASIFSPYVGDSEKSLTQVFHKARLGAPAVLFIDEIDGMVTNRDDNHAGSGVQERVLSVLLNEMDGIGSNYKDTSVDNDVIVVGATNRPELLDAALMRPGRFDKIVYVPPPDFTNRLEILQVATRKIPLASDVNLNEIATRTEGYSGADLENLCKEAALDAMTIQGLENVEEVTMNNFDTVFETFCPSLNDKMLQSYQKLASHF